MSQRAYQMRCRYGINPEDYESMVEEQGGRCAICKREQVLVVDHNHETNAVRGLLCRRCNTALGHFDDDPAMMREAADYVEQRKDRVARVPKRKPGDKRRHAYRLEFQGENLTYAEWGAKLGLSENAIRLRIKRGWSVEKTLSTLPS